MDMRDRIRTLLDEKGIGTKNASRQIGASERWLGHYLDGVTTEIGHERLGRLAELLGVSADHLLFGADRGEDPEVHKVVSIFTAIPKKDRSMALRVLRGMTGGQGGE